MSNKSLKKISMDLDLEDKALQRQLQKTSKMQEYTQQALTPLINSLIVDGVILKDVALLTGQVNQVSHKLGRNLVGYVVVGKDANANIWDEQGTNKLKNITLNLLTDVNCTVNLWVF